MEAHQIKKFHYDIDATTGERWAAVVGSFGPNGVGQNVYDDNIYEVLAAE